MKHIYSCLCSLTILMTGLSDHANSIVLEFKSTPLSKADIEKVISIANFSNPVKLEDDDYFTGEKIENYQDFGNYYNVLYYPDPPFETFPNVIRLNEYSIGIGETSFKSGSCYNKNDQKCRYIPNYLVSLDTQIPSIINQESLKSFIDIGYGVHADFDDATLAYILRIIRIPLAEILTETGDEFRERNYEFTNELHQDLGEYPLNDPDNLYKPVAIGLRYAKINLNTEHGRNNVDRVYEVFFRQDKNSYSMPINLYIKRLNISGTHTSIRIADGPIP